MSLKGHTDKEFLIRIKADIEKAVKDMRRMTGEIDKQGKGARKAKGSMEGMGGAYRRLAAAAGAYITVASAIKALKLADEFNVLQQRIKTATRATGDYNRVSRELYAITQRNGVALADTVSVFQRLQLSAAALGGTNDEILTLTDTVQQLGVIGGSSQAAMTAGLLQFSQAMGAGVVRAEEINSILENLPLLAKKIEQGLGLLPGTLKQAVNEGKVLSRDVFESLLRQAPDIARQFAGISDSLERSGVRLDNSYQRMLASLDKALGVTRELSFFFNQTSGAAGQTTTVGGGFVGFLQAMGLAGPDAMFKIQEQSARLKRQFPGASGAELRKLAEFEHEFEQAVRRMRQVADAANPDFQELRDYLLELQQEYSALTQKIQGRASNTQGENETPPTKDEPTADPKAEARAKKVEAMVKALELEAATYGKTAAQVALYRLALEGATEADLARARIALSSVAALEKRQRLNEAQTEAEQDFMTATYKYAKAQRDARDAVLDSVDPFRAYYREVDRLRELMRQFPEDAALIQRAIDQLTAGLEEGPPAALEKTSQFAIQAARNIQTAIGDGLFDLLQGKFGDISGSFKRMLDRMVANAAAAKLAEKMFGDFGATGGGSLGGWFGGFLDEVFSFHQGGVVGQGGRRMAVNSLLFADAPRYHTGGISGLAPTEVPAILQRGEEVLTRNDPRHRANGGGGVHLELHINNPTDAASFRASESQIGREVARQLAIAQRRLG